MQPSWKRIFLLARRFNRSAHCITSRVSLTECIAVDTGTAMIATKHLSQNTNKALIIGSWPHSVGSMPIARLAKIYNPKPFDMARKPAQKDLSSPQETDVVRRLRRRVADEVHHLMRISQHKNNSINTLVSQLEPNAVILENSKRHLIAATRFLLAMNKGHGINKNGVIVGNTELGFSTMEDFSKNILRHKVPQRNISNFANRDNNTFTDTGSFTVCIILIYCYWIEFIEPLRTQKCAPLHFIELDEDMRIMKTYNKLKTVSPSEFRAYIMSPNATKIYTGFEDFLIGLFRIRTHELSGVKDLFLGGASTRDFAVYRYTSSPEDGVLVCLVKLRDNDKTSFMQYNTYGYSDRHMRVPESIGVVVPMRRAIYFIGARTDGVGLKIYAFPVQEANDQQVAERFTGLLLSIDTVGASGDKTLFSSRVFAQALLPGVKVPDFVPTDSVDPAIIKLIQNKVRTTIGSEIYDERNNPIRSVNELALKLQQTIIEFGSDWTIRDPSGRAINPFQDGAITVVGVLAAMDDWYFVDRVPIRPIALDVVDDDDDDDHGDIGGISNV